MAGGLGALGAVGGILGGISDRRAGKGSNKERKKMQQMALGELTPEAMQRLISQFYTHFMAQMNPQMQAVMSNIGTQAGRSGLTGAGVVQQLKAGVPGQFSQGAMGNAFGAALPIAKQRSGVYSGSIPDYLPLGNWAGIGAKGISGFMGGMGMGNQDYTKY